MSSNHHLLLFVMSLMVPLFNSQPSRYAGPEIEVDFPVIGPFEEGADDYQLKGVATPHYDYDFLREIMYINYRDGSTYSAIMTSWHGVVKDMKFDLTFNLPLRDMLFDDGINVRLLFIDHDKNVRSEYTFNLSPIKPKTINPKDYMDIYYEINDIIVDPDCYGQEISERFMFIDFPDYINVDYYYRLKIDDLSMAYESMKEFVEQKGYIRFYDYYRIFPYLDNKEEVPYFDIPIVAKMVNNLVKFEFSQQMFVNSQSLQMSLRPIKGFVRTKYFYFPLNKSEQLIYQIFTLHFDAFGYGKTSFSWDMRYLTNRTLIGDCNNSEYCVKGELVNE